MKSSFLLPTTLLFVLCFPGTARSAEIEVANTNDAGAGSLRQAIFDATNGDTIVFAPGLDGATILIDTGQIVVNKEVTIDASALPNGITVSLSSAQTAIESRIFSVTQAAVFDSLTIENGKAADATASVSPQNGGGIFTGTALTLRRCTIRNCSAGNGHPSNNVGGFGGGIFNNGTLILEECTIYNNSAGDGFSDGSGGSGGGICHQTGDLTVINSTIFGNQAGSGDAGGMGIGAFGGGIVSLGNVSGTDTVTIISSTISGNEAGVGDTDTGRGGGLLVSSLTDSVDLRNTIIAGNTIGPAPAAADAKSDIDIHISITATTTGVNLIGIRDGAANSFPAPANPGDPNANGDFVGDVSTPLDPSLGSLTDNGGRTLTISPMEGSLAIDPLGGDITPSVPTDQRGFTRLFNGKVDIGAVEFGAEDQERLAAAARAAQIAFLKAKIRKERKKLRNARKKKQIAKVKKIRKKIKRFNLQIRRL